ncbi:MAG: hypothetical protein E6R03_17515 [Hyphomicrobiaceae bacterium]|nr:MAG: hypothetical protein E6R03_17515 [Hyphomicrobiaceae bacterium]
MPGTNSFSEVSYTLTDLLVARYDFNAGTYGNPVALSNGQMAEIEVEADNDQLRGYGAKTRLLSVNVGAKVVIGQGGIDIAALVIMAGVSTQTSGTTPNRVRTVDFSAGGAGMPYFGMIGVAATDDGGYAVIGLQAVKLNSFPKFTLDGKENKFNVSETEGYAVPVGGYLQRIKGLETRSDWTAPTSGANFLAFFSTPAKG